MKRIMSGRKFARIMRYLHVCALYEPMHDGYNPSYKIKEFLESLHKRFKRLFEPGRQLSLDEILVRAFRRMKFKVRIISKAARYGIKIYVLTDAATAYVLKVMVYTGKHTYNESINQSDKKMVQVVKELCKNWEGSYRTVFVDRFYTSIDLLKELRKMNLFVTGTIMKNRIPSEVIVPKSSQTFKRMERGDFKRHTYSYMLNGKREKVGLICWKDRDMVYCVSNEANTQEIDSCVRRSKFGLQTLNRPRMISEYNQFMGGVDLADMRRLHCNSTVMCQNRWWLKLFFYLLDVGTSNALVLYNLSRKQNEQPLSIVDYKRELVMTLVGGRFEDIPEVIVRHLPLRGNQRNRCAYCAMFSRMRRTRFKCSADCCNLPLCSVGTGNAEQDCFTMCHANREIHKAVLAKYRMMQKSVNARYK